MKEISIQITDVEPGGMQFLNSHEEEQCYYIISGAGKMHIDDQTREVQKGDAVFIPEESFAYQSYRSCRAKYPRRASRKRLDVRILPLNNSSSMGSQTYLW